MAGNEKVFLYRQNALSGGANLLARAMGIRMIKPEGSKFTDVPDKTIINWGCGTALNIPTELCTVLNNPVAVGNATNKKKFFELCQANGNVSIPRFTTRKIEAEAWLRDGATLFARTVLQGSGGKGIVEINTIPDLEKVTEGTLLVEYIKKKHEFRIHVANGGIIDEQQKLKRRDVLLEDVNYRIRNHENGFIYARGGIRVPNEVKTEALKVLDIVGLDFGAVDVVWNEKKARAYVLEINTAPGLEGATVLAYRMMFCKLLGINATPMDEYDVEGVAREHGIELDRGNDG